MKERERQTETHREAEREREQDRERERDWQTERERKGEKKVTYNERARERVELHWDLNASQHLGCYTTRDQSRECWLIKCQKTLFLSSFNNFLFLLCLTRFLKSPKWFSRAKLIKIKDNYSLKRSRRKC